MTEKIICNIHHGSFLQDVYIIKDNNIIHKQIPMRGILDFVLEQNIPNVYIRGDKNFIKILSEGGKQYNNIKFHNI